ncbi:hypothetical protein DSO57_1021484 [Entomophthora muscae]|uniref:Uncharacterized protein n=1 Tax=Entomophthora muscae TaxID=34485 RepID=A0ACC2UPT7_9FUNG|nr:hypothetical protein DSO57_1021484 [Entomophthora muscae]
MSKYYSEEEDNYKDPWDIVANYRKACQEAALLNKNTSNNPPPSSDSSKQTSFCPSNSSHAGNSSLDSGSGKVSNQRMAGAPEVVTKKSTFFQGQSEDSLLFKENQHKFHQGRIPYYSSPIRSVSISPPPEGFQLGFLKGPTNLNLPMGSPSILAQTTSQDSIQKMHSVAEKIKDDSKITPKALVRDYTRAKNQVKSLEARLIQEEKQCQRLQSEIEAYAKKLSLKDNEIHNASQQLNSMESAVTKLQSEKANLL